MVPAPQQVRTTVWKWMLVVSVGISRELFTHLCWTGFCDFEMDFCGWVNSHPVDSQSGVDWDWLSGQSAEAPKYDHTTGTALGMSSLCTHKWHYLCWSFSIIFVPVQSCISIFFNTPSSLHKMLFHIKTLFGQQEDKCCSNAVIMTARDGFLEKTK